MILVAQLESSKRIQGLISSFDRTTSDWLLDWGRLQTVGRQERVKAGISNISLGDSRLHGHGTSYRCSQN